MLGAEGCSESAVFGGLGLDYRTVPQIVERVGAAGSLRYVTGVKKGSCTETEHLQGGHGEPPLEVGFCAVGGGLANIGSHKFPFGIGQPVNQLAALTSEYRRLPLDFPGAVPVANFVVPSVFWLEVLAALRPTQGIVEVGKGGEAGGVVGGERQAVGLGFHRIFQPGQELQAKGVGIVHTRGGLEGPGMGALGAGQFAHGENPAVRPSVALVHGAVQARKVDRVCAGDSQGVGNDFVVPHIGSRFQPKAGRPIGIQGPLQGPKGEFCSGRSVAVEIVVSVPGRGKRTVHRVHIPAVALPEVVARLLAKQFELVVVLPGVQPEYLAVDTVLQLRRIRVDRLVLLGVGKRIKILGAKAFASPAAAQIERTSGCGGAGTSVHLNLVKVRVSLPAVRRFGFNVQAPGHPVVGLFQQERQSGCYLGVAKLTGAAVDVGPRAGSALAGTARGDVQHTGKGKGAIPVRSAVGQQFHPFDRSQGNGQIEGVVTGLGVVLGNPVDHHQHLVKRTSTHGQIRLHVGAAALPQVEAKRPFQRFGQRGARKPHPQFIPLEADHGLVLELVPQRTHRYFGQDQNIDPENGVLRGRYHQRGKRLGRTTKSAQHSQSNVHPTNRLGKAGCGGR